MEYATLSNGMKMPMLGIGIFQVPEAECERLVSLALETGYRLIDTAQAYGNEAAVGRAIRQSGLAREDVFATSKLSSIINEDQAVQAIEGSLDKLDIDYVDLFLLHAPWGDSYAAWRALERVLETGRVKAIGVSNFNAGAVADLTVFNQVTPVLDQIEIDPFNQKKTDVAYLRSQGIVPEAWGPLGQGRADLYTNPVLKGIADQHQKTVAQVVLRWNIQRGVVVIPKTTHQERMAENLAIFDFTLTKEEMAAISQFDEAPADFIYDPDYIQQTVAGFVKNWSK
ncbi:aldo/keto reductase [Limosilactobacillus fermentum]|uniref:aldo/keto reductase n=1 Tax=Limosilactobacillus fermentum TaxID=1613 RepID=UPI0007098AB9|nr:aldo/keto reductase [Limosilactobacillus fermentum]KRN12551.1 organophosphate reductase [Limosilactobacillus fermentum]MCH5389010.1 aldo/keto reductase [Limosilactobacillus fermentum]MCH5393547.1 aldo/keto reductase [Limosilactobacillus fermentum]MCT3435199.1 aldo/keto reductase [Limosilactobacillus fermentum]PPX65623.1 aldo/keto reductase [Limosilactobacillus fermentum]